MDKPTDRNGLPQYFQIEPLNKTRYSRFLGKDENPDIPEWFPDWSGYVSIATAIFVQFTIFLKAIKIG